MEAIWNRLQLERPPNTSYRVQRENFDALQFLTTLNKIINDLRSQDILHKEAAILSRLIYRMKSKFRNDKGVKSMSKVNKALLNYLSLSLGKEYENLKDYVEVDERFVTLPSKQMVEYVLVRTQGFAKLMLRVEEVSKYSAHFLKCRIALGHAWDIAVIAYSVVSRIWLLSRHLVKKSCSWYNDLYNYLNSLAYNGLEWLPKGYELMNDLKSWLSVAWIDEPIPSVPYTYGLKNTMFKLITLYENDSDEDVITEVQNCAKEIQAPLADKEDAVDSQKKTINETSIILDDDTGEFIDRHSFNFKRAKSTRVSTKAEHGKIKTDEIELRTKERTSQDVCPALGSETKTKDKGVTRKRRNTIKVSSKKLLSFDDATDISDLMTLLCNDSYPGLDKLRWNMIRNRIKKLLDKLTAAGVKQSILFKKVMKRIKKWIT